VLIPRDRAPDVWINFLPLFWFLDVPWCSLEVCVCVILCMTPFLSFFILFHDARFVYLWFDPFFTRRRFQDAASFCAAPIVNTFNRVLDASGKRGRLVPGDWPLVATSPSSNISCNFKVANWRLDFLSFHEAMVFEGKSAEAFQDG
jgi:hypothetical protein